MTVSPVQLQNYLSTLKIDPGSCHGFEEDALGACMGLVRYLETSDAGRLAWLTAVQNASFNSTGALRAGAASKNFFYAAILNRKNSALGSGIKPYDLSKVDATSYPWALPEAVFRVLDAQVRQGQGLAGRPEVTWDQVVDEISALAKRNGGATPIAGGGGFLLKKFLTKYAPQLATTIFSEWMIVALPIAGFGAVQFENLAARLANADAKANFATDRVRRDFDLSLSGRQIVANQ